MKTDWDIQQDIMNQFQLDPALRSCEIEVLVKNGVTTLKGTVDTYRTKLAAEQTASRVDGVKTVVQEIEVSFSPKKDADIAEIALDVLKKNDDILNCRITVMVQNGWATLEGEVEWEYQKNSAGLSVEDIVGVTGVINNIAVKPKASPEEVTRKTDQFKSAVEQMIQKKIK
jgi:osmotically-inducible protein OsmY